MTPQSLSGLTLSAEFQTHIPKLTVVVSTWIKVSPTHMPSTELVLPQIWFSSCILYFDWQHHHLPKPPTCSLSRSHSPPFTYHSRNSVSSPAKYSLNLLLLYLSHCFILGLNQLSYLPTVALPASAFILIKFILQFKVIFQCLS